MVASLYISFWQPPQGSTWPTHGGTSLRASDQSMPLSLSETRAGDKTAVAPQYHRLSIDPISDIHHAEPCFLPSQPCTRLAPPVINHRSSITINIWSSRAQIYVYRESWTDSRVLQFDFSPSGPFTVNSQLAIPE
jgi:hypothetical protein